MKPEEAIMSIREAFRNVVRPKEFIRGTCHCEECKEHNQTLASHTPDTITLDELGNPGWDPICAANDQAFRYYLPAMIRLACGPDDYLDQLLFHLNCPGRVEALEGQEAKAVLAALWVIVEICEKEIAANVNYNSIEEAIRRLEQRLEPDANSSCKRQQI